MHILRNCLSLFSHSLQFLKRLLLPFHPCSPVLWLSFYFLTLGSFDTNVTSQLLARRPSLIFLLSLRENPRKQEEKPRLLSSISTAFSAFETAHFTRAPETCFLIEVGKAKYCVDEKWCTTYVCTRMCY